MLDFRRSPLGPNGCMAVLYAFQQLPNAAMWGGPTVPLQASGRLGRCRRVLDSSQKSGSKRARADLESAPLFVTSVRATLPRVHAPHPSKGPATRFSSWLPIRRSSTSTALLRLRSQVAIAPETNDEVADAQQEQQKKPE